MNLLKKSSPQPRRRATHHGKPLQRPLQADFSADRDVKVASKRICQQTKTGPFNTLPWLREPRSWENTWSFRTSEVRSGRKVGVAEVRLGQFVWVIRVVCSWSNAGFPVMLIPKYLRRLDSSAWNR